MLVLEKNNNDSNQSIQKVIIENDIPVTDAFKNNAGNLVLECSSVESRDKLKKLGSDVNLELKAIVGKKDNITIVGMNKLFTKEEVIKQLLIQNTFLSHLNTVNDINEHLTIHNIKHTRSNENIFQVFASVSEVLRNGIKKFSIMFEPLNFHRADGFCSYHRKVSTVYVRELYLMLRQQLRLWC